MAVKLKWKHVYMISNLANVYDGVLVEPTASIPKTVKHAHVNNVTEHVLIEMAIMGNIIGRQQ